MNETLIYFIMIFTEWMEILANIHKGMLRKL